MINISPMEIYCLHVITVVDIVSTITLATSLMFIFIDTILYVFLGLDGDILAKADEGDKKYIRILDYYKTSVTILGVILAISVLIKILIPTPDEYRKIIAAEALENSTIESTEDAKEIIDYYMNYNEEQDTNEQ